MAVGASPADVLAAAEAVEAEVERAREAALVAQLKEAVATGRRGVAGLAGTLAALVGAPGGAGPRLEGLRPGGLAVPRDGRARARRPEAPRHGHAMVRVGDVVEDAIEVALTQGIPVTICVGNADLDVLGRIGALLRY